MFEETDFDLAALINPRSYLEVYVSKQRCRLFLIPGDEKMAVKPVLKFFLYSWEALSSWNSCRTCSGP